MDEWGIHAESCTAGGDKTSGHHAVRNDLYVQSKRGATAPVLEASGVLNVLGISAADRGVGPVGDQATAERPADVLLCRAHDIVTGAGGMGNGRVALDVGIVCPQAASHLGDAAGESLGAAEAYVRAKCERHLIERRCREAGVVFQPMIFESLGGVSAEAERVIKCLNKRVAANTESPEGEVATQFWHRVSIDIQRSGHRAFARRVSRGVDEGGFSLAGDLGVTQLLAMPGDL